MSLQTAPQSSNSRKFSGLCVRLSLRLSPTRWNVKRTLTHWRQSCVVAGQRCATVASNPSHTPPQHHSSIFHPPCTHAPLKVCLQLNCGRGVLGVWGYQVSFWKKNQNSCQDWLKMEHAFMQSKLSLGENSVASQCPSRSKASISLQPEESV